MAESFLLYFGCWGSPGHYIFDRNGSKAYNVPALAIRGEDLDGSHVFLPRPEVPGHGRLTHVIRGDRCVTVLAWWDRTFDQRGACNAAIQCDGWETAAGLWARFSRVYDQLAKQLTMPRLSESEGESR